MVAIPTKVIVMKKLIAAILIATTFAASAQTINIDSIIQAQMAQKHIPAVSALIVKKGEPVWYKAYGKSYIEMDINATPGTSFMLASVSKTVTATALMQVWENGGFSLNDDINDYLPFEVHHPDFPNDIITIKHLLTHTSGIADDWDVLDAYYVEGVSPVALGDFMEDYLTPAGANYDASTCFNTHAPGTFYEYTNMGASLCGYLVEAITGINFSQYCRDSIFTPLCMDNTAWFINELDFNNVALPYFYENNLYQGVPHYGYPDYPDGQLRTNSTSLGRFLNMYMNYGVHNGTRILDSATVALMLSEQIPGIEPGQGLIWYSYPFEGTTVWGHSGGDVGVSTEMLFSPTDSIGVILLTNGDDIDMDIILSKLYAHGKNLTTITPTYPCGTLLADYEQPAKEKQLFDIYPNPSSTTVTLSTGNSFLKLPICIYDITGKKINDTKETDDRKIILDISNYQKGIYVAVWNGISTTFIVE